MCACMNNLILMSTSTSIHFSPQVLLTTCHCAPLMAFYIRDVDRDVRQLPFLCLLKNEARYGMMNMIKMTKIYIFGSQTNGYNKNVSAMGRR